MPLLISLHLSITVSPGLTSVASASNTTSRLGCAIFIDDAASSFSTMS